MSANKSYQSLLIGATGFLFLALSVITGRFSFGQMSSDNYKLCTSVLSEGGRDASSTNYKAITIIGQPSSIGEAANSSYNGYYGFWQEILGQEVGIEDRAINITPDLPRVFSLSQNYPNPFNPMTEIKYALPVDCQVKLEVYNLLGQKVATLVDEKQAAGYKTIRWDSRSQIGNEISSGIYFYHLQAGEFVETKRMVLLK